MKTNVIQIIIIVCFLVILFMYGYVLGNYYAPKEEEPYAEIGATIEVDNSKLIDSGYFDSTYLDNYEDSEQEMVRRIIELLEQGNVRFEMHLDLNQDEGTTGTMDIYYEK